MRHTQEFKNGSHMAEDLIAESDHAQLASVAKELYYEGTMEVEYQSKYGKFSSTFSKPLGFSSMNHKLVSQQSTNQQQNTQEYFFLSGEQLEQQSVNEIEE